MSLAAIILAAGKGTRMRSERAKVLHELGGEPMIARTLRAIASLRPNPIVVVVGHQASEVKAAVQAALPSDAVTFAIQDQQRGTGDAARSAIAKVPERFAGDVLIAYGDMPMITPATLRAFAAAHRASGAKLSFVSVKLDNPREFGRVVRDA